MSVQFTLPEHGKIVEAITPQAGAAITADYVSLKNYHCCFVIVHINQANAAQVAITIEQATAVLPAGSIAITQAVPIWVNAACTVTDTLVAQADAVAFTTDAGVEQKVIVFKVDASHLDLTFDCITVITAASNAANITSAMYVMIPSRYADATPPSAILD